MLKKTLAAIGIAGFLVLGGSSAASADYTAEEVVTASDVTLTVGESTTITATNLGDLETVNFSTDGTPGGTLASIALANTGPLAKPVVDGVTSATFTATQPGTFVVAVSDGETVLDTVTITVTAAGTTPGTTVPGTTTPGTTTPGTTLPATGGQVPAAALWAGVGAISVGGIAVAAAAARRRAATNR